MGARQAIQDKDSQHSAAPTPAEAMRIAQARETSLSRLLMVYVTSGLVFMLLPGTFLGVRNLLQINAFYLRSRECVCCGVRG